MNPPTRLQATRQKVKNGGYGFPLFFPFLFVLLLPPLLLYISSPRPHTTNYNPQCIKNTPTLHLPPPHQPQQPQPPPRRAQQPHHPPQLLNSHPSTQAPLQAPT